MVLVDYIQGFFFLHFPILLTDVCQKDNTNLDDFRNNGDHISIEYSFLCGLCKARLPQSRSLNLTVKKNIYVGNTLATVRKKFVGRIQWTEASPCCDVCVSKRDCTCTYDLKTSFCFLTSNLQYTVLDQKYFHKMAAAPEVFHSITNFKPKLHF